MRFFYPYPEPLVEGKARHLQAWQTAVALAAHHPLTMAVADRCEFSGKPENLQILLWPRFFHFGPLKISFQSRFMWHCGSTLSKLSEDVVVYVRHLRLADYLLSKQPKQKVIFEVHEFFSDNPDLSFDKSMALQKMEERVFLKSSGLVCISQGLVDALKERFLKLPPMVVAADGCSPVRLSSGETNGNDADLVYVGSLHAWKGVETLIKAMVYLPGRKLKIIGGQGHEIEKLKELSKRWGVGQQCQFLGQVRHQEVEQQISRARLGIVPNHPHVIGTSFTSPLKVFEYLAAGKPIVASDLPSLRELLNDATARFVPAESPRSLAVAAEGLLSDEKMMIKMSQAARQLAQDYTWEKRAEKICRFIEEI